MGEDDPLTCSVCGSGDASEANPIVKCDGEHETEVGTHLDEVDEAFVFVLSDANLERYGIRPSDLAKELTAMRQLHHPNIVQVLRVCCAS